MLKRLIALIVCLTFSFSNIQYLHAQDFSVNQLPVPGTMIEESAPFAPLALKGLVVDPQKPLEFQFIVDTGKGPQDVSFIKEEANKLVKYFLAGLTIPEGDLWVNLSPYEKNRITTPSLGLTELGRDLLAQDYILKQLTASLIYPEKDLGKEFWSRVYARAQQQFGTTDVPVNTFNKVWILPKEAQVFENGSAAYVTKSTLKVMLDEDYLSLKKHSTLAIESKQSHTVASQIIREIILPEIEKEVNTGRNFALIRQIYQALILAKWYKQTIQNGILDAVYTNKKKTAGVNLDDPAVKEQIYQRYLKAYKKGVFNYIKEDASSDGQVIPRKYFSGGTYFGNYKVNTDGAVSAVKSDGTMEALVVDLEKPNTDRDFAMRANKTEMISYKELLVDQQALRSFNGSEGDRKALQDKIEKNQRSLDILETNLRLILQGSFISDLRDRIISFKKDAVGETEAQNIADTLLRGNEALVRALAIELEKRLVFRDGLLLFMRPVSDPVQKKLYKNEIDRYNRVVEGVTQLLTSGDYGKESIFINSWTYTKDEFNRVQQEGKEKFTQLFFGRFLSQAKAKLQGMDLTNITDPNLRAVLEKIANMGNVEDIDGDSMVKDYVQPLIDNHGLNILGDFQEKFFLYSAPPGAGKGTIMKVTFEGEENKAGVYVKAPYEDIVKKYVLIHSRDPRAGEVNGVAYHFWPKEKIESMSEGANPKIAKVLVNGSLQAIVLHTFSEPLVIDTSKESEKVLPTDRLISEEGNIKTVERTYTGILDVFKEDSLYFLEGGYAWFQYLKEKYPNISLGFISPFSEQEMQNRSEVENWLEQSYGTADPQNIRKAYEVLDNMVEQNKGEIALSDAVKSEIQQKVQDLAQLSQHLDNIDQARKNIGSVPLNVVLKYFNNDPDLFMQQMGKWRDEFKTKLGVDVTVEQMLLADPKKDSRFEFFDIVDANGIPTGKIRPRALVHRDGDLHRDVRIILVNSKGEVLVQKRGDNKDVEPGLFSESAGGHLALGENFDQGLKREINEELGIKDIDKARLKIVRSNHRERVTGADKTTGIPTINDAFYTTYRYQLNPGEEAGMQVNYSDGIKGVTFEKPEELRSKIQANPDAYVKSLREAFLEDNSYRQINDHAMSGQTSAVRELLSKNGGIDLNQINVKRTGKIIKVQFDPDQLNELTKGGFEGFMPVIINISPISDPLQLLGVS